MKEFCYEYLKPHKLERVTEGGKRLYVTESGEKYPSVTTVLSYFSKKSIAKWRRNIGAENANRISTQAARFGTMVHNIAEDYMLGELDVKKASPIALDSFRRIQPFLDANVTKVYGIELQMYSHELKTAGTADLICEYNGELTLLDFKTSRRRKKREDIYTYFMQCAAYSVMVKELYDMDITQAVILMSVNDDEPIEFVEEIAPWIKMTRSFFSLYNQGKFTPS